MWNFIKNAILIIIGAIFLVGFLVFIFIPGAMM